MGDAGQARQQQERQVVEVGQPTSRRDFGAALGLAYYALVLLHAGFAQTLLALVPLVTLLLAVVQRQERLHVAAVAGTLLAVAGIAVMSRAAYGFVLTPFITVVLSAWLDDEPIHVGLILGGFLVLAGVSIGALRPSRVPSAPPPA